MLAHTPTATELPPPLAGWCRDVLGPYTVASTHSQAHRESQVWRLVTGDEAVYLKAHRRYAKWAMEVHAYEQWAPALGDQAPRLIATREDPFQAILTTALPGAPLERAALPAESSRPAGSAAGAALARLHSLPANQWFGAPARNGQPQATVPKDDPIALVGTSLEYRLTRGITGELLDTHEIAVVQRALDAVEVFAGERPTPCHGDYLPRNWIVDAAGMWRGMIDFEHARWDLRMNDLGYWWDRNFSKRPDLAAAFLAGYGGSLDEREHTQLYVIRVLCAYIIRAGGANPRYSEFSISYAIAVGGVFAIALIGHNNCGMVNLMVKKAIFIEGLARHEGWDAERASEHFMHFAPMFEIDNEIDFVISEAKRLRLRYPNVLIVPLLYRVEDRRLYLIEEKL